MLVYLDTAQFDLIERATHTDPDAVRALVAAFETHGCTLALTRTHLFEMAPTSAGSITDVIRRFEAVWRFPRLVRATWNAIDLVYFEAAQQVHRILVPAADDGTPLTYAVVRAALWQPASGWDSLGDRIQLEPVIRADRIYEEFRGRLLNDLRAGPAYTRLVRASNTRTNIRRVAAAIGIGDWRSVGRAPWEDLHVLKYWGGIIEGPLIAHYRQFRYSTEQVRAAIAQVEWYDLPAWSYTSALMRGLRSGVRYRPSDAYDSEHLPAMAYTDLAFSDSRVVGWITTELRDRRHLLSSAVSPWISRASSLRDITMAIAARSAALRNG